MQFLSLRLAACIPAALPLSSADAPAQVYTAVHCGTLLDVRTGHGIRDAMLLIEDGEVHEAGAAARVRLLACRYHGKPSKE
jgi:hypothetical protein